MLMVPTVALHRSFLRLCLIRGVDSWLLVRATMDVVVTLFVFVVWLSAARKLPARLFHRKLCCSWPIYVLYYCRRVHAIQLLFFEVVDLYEM